MGLSLRVHVSAEPGELASPDPGDVEWREGELQCDLGRVGQPVYTVRDGIMSMFSPFQGTESSEYTSRQPFMLELNGTMGASVEPEEVLLLLYHKSRDLET